MTETSHIFVMRQDSNDVGLLLVTVHYIQYVGNKTRSLNLPKTTRMVKYSPSSLLEHIKYVSCVGADIITATFIPFTEVCLSHFATIVCSF